MLFKKHTFLKNQLSQNEPIDRAKNFTRGGQITFHNLRMLLQINKTVGKIFLWIFFVLFLPIIYLITPYDVFVESVYYWYARLLNFSGFTNKELWIPYQGVKYPILVNQVVRFDYFQNIITVFKHYVFLGLAIDLVISGIILYLIVRWLTKRGSAQTNTQFIRGTYFEPIKSFVKRLNKDRIASDIHIDSLPLLKDAEVKHFFIHGTTGTGKSQLILKLLSQIRARGQKVIIYDKGCNFLPHFYREGKDHLLNPFDSRCAAWDIWAEGNDPTLFENMANALIPMHGESDPFWVNAARTIFSSAAYKMGQDKTENRSNAKLLKLLLTQPLEEMSEYLANTESASLVDNRIEKTAISIKSVLATYLKSLRFLSFDQNGTEKISSGESKQMGWEKETRETKEVEETKEQKKFSIQKWVQNDKDDSWIFITSNDQQQASLRPLMSMWLALAANFILSLKESYRRRIWEIIDELPSLHKLPELPETIAEARKYGGCFVLGMQSQAQLRKVYGMNAAAEITDLLNTRFFFRNPSHEMASWTSKELGEQEIEESRENYSYGANTIRDGISIGRQRAIRSVVPYPEIMQLPDLTCFVRYPGELPITQLKLILVEKPQAQNKDFLGRTLYVEKDLERLIIDNTIYLPELMLQANKDPDYVKQQVNNVLKKTTKPDQSKRDQQIQQTKPIEQIKQNEGETKLSGGVEGAGEVEVPKQSIDTNTSTVSTDQENDQENNQEKIDTDEHPFF